MEELSSISQSPRNPSSSRTNPSKSSTPSIWEISNKSSSSNSSSFSDLKRRNELLRIQLKQREAELAKEKMKRDEKIGEKLQAQSEAEQMKAKIAALTLISDDLQQIIASCEEEQERRLRELATMYRGHFEEITEMTTRLRNENGELKKRLIDHQAKNFSHSQENKFLRWENDTTKSELEKLKNQLENKDKEISELKMEIITQKLAQQKLAQTTNAKLERVIQTTAQSTSTQLNSIKMQFEDREKEYGLTLTKIRNEMEFLQKELERRENQVNRLTHRLDELTIDNKKMLDINTELRHDTDDELAVLKSEISRYRNELDVLRDQNENLKFSFKENTQRASSTKERHEMVTHQQRLEQAQTLIRALRAQIYDLRKVTPQNLSDKSAHRELQRSRLELAEIREKHRQVEKDCNEERQQRMDLTEILLEMSKDLQEIIQWSKILEARV